MLHKCFVFAGTIVFVLKWAVTVHFQRKQLLLFVFQRENINC